MILDWWTMIFWNHRVPMWGSLFREGNPGNTSFPNRTPWHNPWISRKPCILGRLYTIISEWQLYKSVKKPWREVGYKTDICTLCHFQVNPNSFLLFSSSRNLCSWADQREKEKWIWASYFPAWQIKLAYLTFHSFKNSVLISEWKLLDKVLTKIMLTSAWVVHADTHHVT